MPLSDSDDDSSVSSGGSLAEPSASKVDTKPNSSPRTSSTFQDSDSDLNLDDISSDDDSDDSSDDDSPPSARRGGRRPGGVARTKSSGGEQAPPTRRAPARNKSFEGDEHMRMRALMGEFNKHTTYKSSSLEKERKLIGKSDLNLSAAEESIKAAQALKEKARSSLDSSCHSLELIQKQIEDDLAALNTSDDNDELKMPLVASFSFKDQLRKGKKPKKDNDEKKSSKVQEVKLAQQMRELKREQRLARARERIQREEDEKEDKERQAKLKEKKIDNSEAARRERIYGWYLRMAMPKREVFVEKVEALPFSAHVTVEDIDLLTWNARGTRAFKITDSV